MAERVMMIVGEASGDLHAAGVIREMKKRNPAVELYGVGGDKMIAEGFRIVYHIREVNFMGFVEVIRHLPVIRAVTFTLKQILQLKRPDVVVLVDYPGFNLRFAKIVKKLGIRIVYYISPQVWAWHRSRVKQMKKLVDKMLVIFPFEVPFYEKEGVPVEFVGHPLLEVVESTMEDRHFRKRYGLDPELPILAVLPGSRRQEIDNIFPAMLSAAKAVARERNMQVAIGVAPTLDEGYFRTMHGSGTVPLVKGATYDLMHHAAFAMVTSGTATLETAMFSTPMVVVYKTSWMTYLIGRLLVQVKNIGLVNIVAGRTIVPEFIQHRATAKNLAESMMDLFEEEGRLATMREELGKVRELLGSSGASAIVADRIMAES